MDISCVILSYNSARSIETCLRSVFESLEATGLLGEVWVVDNGSTDGSRESILGFAEKHPNLSLISLQKNQGTTVSRNQAIRKCTGRSILVLDSDAYITREALSGLVTYLERNPSVGLVAPRLVFPDGRPQLSTDQFPTVLRKIERVLRLRQIERGLMCPKPGEVDYAISACWLLRRELIDAIGLLDEAIFYAPEDVDYCLRIWKGGYRVVYEPQFEVIHDAQERSRKLLPNRFTWLHLQGLAYYFWKHRYAWSVKGLRNPSSGN